MSGPYGPNDTPGPGEGHSSDQTPPWTGQQSSDPTQHWGGQQPAGQQQWSQPGQTSWPPQATGNADPTQQWTGQQSAPQPEQWGQSGASWPQQQPAQPQPWEPTQQQWGQPPQQPQQWNQSGQWNPEQPPQQQPDLQLGSPKKSRRGLIIGGIGAVVVIVVAVVLAVIFLGSDELDNSAVQSGVQKVLKDSYGIDDVQNVSCPSGQEVTVGKTFTCSLKVGGEQKSVTIKVTKSDGTYEVGRPN